ncbi:uncharacterized protein ATNIH1004_001959 [Aspergillus tanneri]|uniref:Uncharacterized protein n=1 Tax=Aspergillus tanneri TaxID=1220188 RepID=A0A5M9MED0_9EURO|nr:uncharacterized protein ATNIH1004_001959 [Aspergillus tanneri]KAA8641357.1 hypothetical protein ATNIH1004_001959 [Aspergillus tanneri]
MRWEEPETSDSTKNIQSIWWLLGQVAAQGRATEMTAVFGGTTNDFRTQARAFPGGNDSRGDDEASAAARGYYRRITTSGRRFSSLESHCDRKFT